MNQFSSLLLTLWPIILVLFCWSALTVYVFIKAPVKYYLRFTLIPTLLISAIFSVAFLQSSLGYSVPIKIPNEFEYLGHNILLDKSNKKSLIEIWVNDKRTRLHLIPYTKEAEKKLSEAFQKRKSGLPVIMKNAEQAEREKETEDSGFELDDYESNILLPHEANPKFISPEN